jgi:hypothetical protein
MLILENKLCLSNPLFLANCNAADQHQDYQAKPYGQRFLIASLMSFIRKIVRAFCLSLIPVWIPASAEGITTKGATKMFIIGRILGITVSSMQQNSFGACQNRGILLTAVATGSE